MWQYCHCWFYYWFHNLSMLRININGLETSWGNLCVYQFCTKTTGNNKQKPSKEPKEYFVWKIQTSWLMPWNMVTDYRVKGTIQLKSEYVLKCANVFIIMPEIIDFCYIISFRLPTANRHPKLTLVFTHLTPNHCSLFSITLLIWLSSLIYVLFLSAPL